ncbi:MAG: TetR family transcriptional regulator C-terminal domain-containing protein, partial [Candidatus Binataceae bacterium]
AKDPEVRRLLRRTLDGQIGGIRDAVAAARRSGALSDGADAEYVAAAVMVFIMGLMHLETLSPRLIGDPGWEAFVKEHAATLLESR